MPKYRTEKYAIWRACERWKILPPGVKNSWDDNSSWIQANLIAFDQIRQIERQEREVEYLKATHGKSSKAVVR